MDFLATVDVEVLVITLIMIVLDLITGFIGALKEKNVQSEKLRQGLWHKSGFIGLIVLAYIVEYASMRFDLGFQVPTVLAVLIYIIVTEAISIFENLCVLNPDLVKSPLGSIFHNTEKIKQAEKLEAKNQEEEEKEGKHVKGN